MRIDNFFEIGHGIIVKYEGNPVGFADFITKTDKNNHTIFVKDSVEGRKRYFDVDTKEFVDTYNARDLYRNPETFSTKFGFKAAEGWKTTGFEIYLPNTFNFESSIFLVVRDVSNHNVLASIYLSLDEHRIFRPIKYRGKSLYQAKFHNVIPYTSNDIEVSCAVFDAYLSETEPFAKATDDCFVLTADYVIGRNFVPVIPNKLNSGVIRPTITVEDTGYIVVGMEPTEIYDTLQGAIEKTLPEETNDYAISTRYRITYGTEEIGYKSLTVSNEEFPLAPIRFVPDTKFLIEHESDITSYEFGVEAIVTVGEVSIIRQTDTIVNLTPHIFEGIESKLVRNVKPIVVEPKLINEIENKVIKTTNKVKILEVPKVIYAEVITEDISIATSKNVSLRGIFYIEKMQILDDKNKLVEEVWCRYIKPQVALFDLESVISTVKPGYKYCIRNLSKDIVRKGTFVK